MRRETGGLNKDMKIEKGHKWGSKQEIEGK